LQRNEKYGEIVFLIGVNQPKTKFKVILFMFAYKTIYYNNTK
jgi:hypothetical protein